jgi:hypothetical protein
MGGFNWYVLCIVVEFYDIGEIYSSFLSALQTSFRKKKRAQKISGATVGDTQGEGEFPLPLQGKYGQSVHNKKLDLPTQIRYTESLRTKHSPGQFPDAMKLTSISKTTK